MDVKIESSWKKALNPLFEKPYFTQITNHLKVEKELNRIIYPKGNLIFNAFNQTPFNDVKVVILGPDPYHQSGQAMGLSFSVPDGVKIPPSLNNIYKELNKDIGMPIPSTGNLTKWATQGVLLLNTALTCQVDKIGSHYNIWNEFVMYVFDMLNFTNSGLIFVLLGAKAQELESIIGPNHYILKASHPASAAYTKTTWDCKNIFLRANEIIEANNGKTHTINW
jgi:uracil-DNA glycosylase